MRHRKMKRSHAPSHPLGSSAGRGCRLETRRERRRPHGSPSFRRLGAVKGRSSPEATRASAPLTAPSRRNTCHHEVDGAAGRTAPQPFPRKLKNRHNKLDIDHRCSPIGRGAGVRGHNLLQYHGKSPHPRPLYEARLVKRFFVVEASEAAGVGSRLGLLGGSEARKGL